MRRLFIILTFVLAALFASAQEGQVTHVRSGAALPSACNPSTGDVFFKTTSTVGLYYCDSANHWTLPTSSGGGGGGTSYSFSSPLSLSGSTVSIDLSTYSTQDYVNTALATKLDASSFTRAAVVGLWGTCTGYLKNDGTCSVPTGAGTDASTASGSTPEQKILNAADTTTLHLVNVPGSMTGGYDASTPLKSMQLVLDWRGCSFNIWSTDCTSGWAISSGALLRNRIAEATRAPNTDTYQTLQVHMDADTGGINQSTPSVQKSNFASFTASQRSYTPGQHFAGNFNIVNGSQGDTFGVGVNAFQYGETNAGGDEGLKGVGITVAQGREEFTGTVASVAGNVVNYSSPVAEYSRGEGRLLLNTSRSVYSAGTISAIAGAPIVVTGSGTAWDTLGTGSKSNLCFALDGGNAANSLLYVVRVASVDSATQLTLDSPGGYGQLAWAGDATSGTYKIYRCSPVAAVAKAGNVTVADGTQFQAGDSLRMPLGSNLAQTGLSIATAKYLPGGAGANGISLTNDTSSNGRAMGTAVQVQGPWADGVLRWLASDNTRQDVISTQGRVAGNIVNWQTGEDDLVRLWLLNRNATPIYGATTGNFTLQFEKQFDTFRAGQGYFVFNGTTAGVDFRVSTYNDIPYFGVVGGGPFVNMGKALTFYSDNQGTTTANVNGATGAATFANLTLTGTGCGAGTYAKADGTGCVAVQHARISTGSIAGGASAAVTLTWPTSLSDTNYTPQCSVIEATASTVTLRVHHLESITATTVVVRVVNDDGTGAHTGTLACTAFHD